MIFPRFRDARIELVSLRQAVPRGQGFYFFSNGLNAFIKSELETTLTELSAIAAPAIIGFNRNPVNG